MSDDRVLAVTPISTQFQVTVKLVVRVLLDLKVNDELEWVKRNGEIVVRKKAK